MRKNLAVMAATIALGTITTTTAFAATNPFSDVPSDSWAYDAVSTLSADGIIDGYPDGTYQGKNTMTRYEMAQIVARAMAKTDMDKADRAIVDKLAAEFADELDNLGVRVADLEKKSDNLTFSGKIRDRYYEIKRDKGKEETYNKILLRLDPKAYIGDTGWTANARIEYTMDTRTDSNASQSVPRAYVKGPIGDVTVSLGRQQLKPGKGFLMDKDFTGVRATMGSKVFKTDLYAGRFNFKKNDYDDSPNARDLTGEIFVADFAYNPTKNLNLIAGYFGLHGIDSEYNGKTIHAWGYGKGYGDSNKANIWYVGGTYKFDDNVSLFGAYGENTSAESYETAKTVQLNYKKAKANDPGSWGAYVGYRYLGQNVAIKPTYYEATYDQKGYVAGLEYTFAENIVGYLQYFDGKDITSDTDASKLFSQVEFYF